MTVILNHFPSFTDVSLFLGLMSLFEISCTPRNDPILPFICLFCTREIKGKSLKDNNNKNITPRHWYCCLVPPDEGIMRMNSSFEVRFSSRLMLCLVLLQWITIVWQEERYEEKEESSHFQSLIQLKRKSGCKCPNRTKANAYKESHPSPNNLLTERREMIGCHLFLSNSLCHWHQKHSHFFCLYSLSLFNHSLSLYNFLFHSLSLLSSRSHCNEILIRDLSLAHVYSLFLSLSFTLFTS